MNVRNGNCCGFSLGSDVHQGLTVHVACQVIPLSKAVEIMADESTKLQFQQKLVASNQILQVHV